MSAAADRVAPPLLPIAPRWSVELGDGVRSAPVSDGDRIYLALRSAQIVAREMRAGREIWRAPKDTTVPLAVGDGLVFAAAGDAIEALRGEDGRSVWMVPRVTPVAPLLASGGWLIAVTDAEILAIRARDGEIVWRHAAGGVRQPPAIDGDRLVVGADDGRILAFNLTSGAVLWEKFVAGGVTALAAHRGLVYAGAGDKHLYCLDGRDGDRRWLFRVGSAPFGRIAVDDDRVYFASLDNVVRALDRATGNQRWQTPLSKRPIAGVRAAGHVVFVPVAASELIMLFDRDGRRSGVIALPGETTSRDTPPDVREAADGLQVSVVTGGLSNQWQLTFVGPVGEATLHPFAEMAAMPGAPLLTDPVAARIGDVLPWLVLGDPILQPLAAAEWPIVLRDPPLQPLTTLPGLQLRPLSPLLPSRRGG